MLTSNSCLLTDIVAQLHEPAKKVNVVERLTKHLNKGISKTMLFSYLKTIKKDVSKNPVIHIDNSDITKPEEHNFELLDTVRDGSASSSTKNY